jgi:hypothetical protein
MKRNAVRVLVAFALIGAGFSIGPAQPSVPNFELRIDAAGPL